MIKVKKKFSENEVFVFTLGIGMVIIELVLPKYAKLNPFSRISVFEFFPLIFCGFSIGASAAAIFKKTLLKWASMILQFLPILILTLIILSLHSTNGWIIRINIIIVMFFFGALIAQIYQEGITERIYFFDLLGIAVGVAFYALALSSFGPENIILIFLLFYYVGRLYYKSGFRIINIFFLLLILAALILNIQSGNTLADPLRKSKYSSTAKPENKLFLMRPQDSISPPKIIQTIWNLVSRVDLVANDTSVFKIIVGDELCKNENNYIRGKENLPEYSLYYDGMYYTTINPPFYFRNHFGLVSGGRGLIIGMGGGRDIVHAVSNGIQEIVACEINPGVIKLLDYDGIRNQSKADWEKVTVEPIDGRTYVQYHKDSFDLIQISFAELYMSFPNSRVFMEAYLYTKESMNSCINALTENGVLYVDKFSSLKDEDNQEMFRLITTILEVLKEQGKPNPEKHILVLSIQANLLANRTRNVVNLYVSKKEISESFFENMIKPTIISPYQLVYFHSVPAGTNSPQLNTNIEAFVKSLSEQNQSSFYNKYRFDITPTTDDKPFFYSTNKSKPETILNLLLTGLLITLFSIFPVILSLFRNAKTNVKKMDWAGILSFSLLGGAFGLLQSYILQNVAVFLGSPVLAMVFTLGIIPLFAGLGGLFHNRLKFMSVYVLICFVIVWMLGVFFWGETVYGLLFSKSLTIRFLVVGIVYLPVMFIVGSLYPYMMLLQNKVNLYSKSELFALNTGVMAIAIAFSLYAAVHWGFSMVLFICLTTYLVAMMFHLISVSLKRPD